jgi:cytochrome c peroxidase
MSSAFASNSALRHHNDERREARRDLRNTRTLTLGLLAASLRAATWIGTSLAVQSPAAYAWTLRSGFLPPQVPADNPMSAAKVELGRHLFYDTRLSANGTQSCATCHEQARAFTDGKARSIGSAGQLHPRGSMSLVNVADAAVLTWANPTLTQLEDQALVPMYGEHPLELGLSPSGTSIATLKRDESYRRLFTDAFSSALDPFTRENAVKAIASFERSLVSARSPYDRYHFDRDDSAVSAEAKRGEVLIHSRPLSCFMCHGGIYFSNAMGSERRSMPVDFHNTGLYNLTGGLSYPTPNTSSRSQPQ